LNEKLERKADRTFLEKAQRGWEAWRDLLRRSADEPGKPMKPGRIVREVGDRLADDAIVVWDSGHNTGLMVRYLMAKAGQSFVGSGLLASMGCAVPYAIAASLAFPGRQVVAFIGDGGLAMLLGELVTIARYRLPIKIVLLKNGTLGQIKWEQMMFLGNPEFECDLTDIDFAKVAGAMGLKGFHVEDPAEAARVAEAALAHPGAALIEAVIDPNEPFLPPKRMEKYVENLEKALDEGTPGADEIRAAMEREPAHTMLQD
jgi:pyruvate dehydrogenase (quinone)